MNTLGNISLLSMLPLRQAQDRLGSAQIVHGFLCSRSTKSSVILPSLDWAAKYANGTEPVISTFHSEMESAVLDILLQGTCPIILVLGRSIYKNIPDNLQEAFEANRLLIVSVMERRGINRMSAAMANQYICDNATDLTFGFLSPDSSLYPMYEDAVAKGKPTTILCK